MTHWNCTTLANSVQSGPAAPEEPAVKDVTANRKDFGILIRNAIFRLDDHIRRLFDSAKIYRMRPDHSASTLVEAGPRVQTILARRMMGGSVVSLPPGCWRCGSHGRHLLRTS